MNPLTLGRGVRERVKKRIRAISHRHDTISLHDESVVYIVNWLEMTHGKRGYLSESPRHRGRAERQRPNMSGVGPRWTRWRMRSIITARPLGVYTRIVGRMRSIASGRVSEGMSTRRLAVLTKHRSDRRDVAGLETIAGAWRLGGRIKACLFIKGKGSQPR